jgi:hypothetical protein
VDTAREQRENDSVLRPGDARKRLAQRLKAAYADGLLSDETFTDRLDRALAPGLVDPWRLIGDLSFRAPSRGAEAADASHRGGLRWWPRRNNAPEDDSCPLLALDWSGGTTEVVLGRHRSCDVVFSDDAVSRRHARIFFRDGSWILQDLESTNGTRVNGVRVGRCRLRPGDRVHLGHEDLRID